MDINGARALARRVGPTEPSRGGTVVPGDASAPAPPVFQWFGIDQPRSSRSAVATDPESAADGSRWFSLLRR
jgi:hypothetical protein